jgi:FtsP/CotA-like multicopper oxidase with cupredoxin domain
VTSAAPDETIEITVVKHNGALQGFNQWTLNGEAFSMEAMKPMYMIRQGRRYRVRLRNASDDIHPVHLHRHSFCHQQLHMDFGFTALFKYA